ncbi:MAG: hypothetical protein OHK0029_23310 [Armatimonadaceae bacterium]
MKIAGKRIWGVRLAAAFVTAFGAAAAALAQEAAAPRPGKDLLTGIVNTVIFGCIGIALAIAGFKLFDILIKHNVEKEVFDNKNMAAAALSGAVILGVCLIIAATILSP